MADVAPKRKKKKVDKKSAKPVVPPRFKIIDEDDNMPPCPVAEAEHKSEASCSDTETNPVMVLVDNQVDELRLYGKFRVDNWTSKTRKDSPEIKREPKSDSDSDLDVRRSSNQKSQPKSGGKDGQDSDSDISIKGRSSSSKKPVVKSEPKSPKRKEDCKAGLKHISKKASVFHDDNEDEEPIRRTKQYKSRHERKKREPMAEELKRTAEMKEKYKVWNKGTKQVTERQEKLDEMAQTIEQPFARYKDDRNLDEDLKGQLLDEDPMFAYMHKKRLVEAGPVATAKATKQGYKGHAPPNRFGILPGVRWDGVDRSNGFENKLLSTANTRKADEDEYYAWTSGQYE